MMMRVLAKIGNKSLVEVYEKEDFGKEVIREYRIVTDFVEGKPYESCPWNECLGIFNANNKEKALKYAMERFIGVDARESQLSYDNAINIIRGFIDMYINEDDIEEDVIEKFNLTDDACNILGIERKRKYDIVEIELEVTYKTTKKIVVPSGTCEDKYDVDTYVYFDDVNDLDLDWSDSEIEIRSVDIEKSELTGKEAIDYENRYDLYNSVSDVEDMF